jgi:hypothetical protein
MKKINFLVLFFALAFMSVQAQNVYYVTADADGSADGLSWATATSLDAAIAKTTSASTDVILVKKGTYTAPSAAQSTSTGSSISGLGYLVDTKNDVSIYGNCDGTESATNLPIVDQNSTIQTYLQAPVDGTGTLGRVISIYKSNVAFIGFDISGGDAAKVSSTSAFGQQVYGGSVWINGKGTLKYCKIHSGTATQGGGGVYLSKNGIYTPATLDGCEIYGNSVTTDVTNKGGGGLYISEADVYIKNCTIRNNTAARAGGIYVSNTSTTPTSATLISNCIIKDNTVTATTSTAPGGVQFYKAGTIVNSLITGNTGYTAGGVALGSVSQIINSTIVNNTVTSNGASDAGGIVVGAGFVKNCIIWGNTKNNGATNIDLRLASHATTQANVSTVTNSCYNVASVTSAALMPDLSTDLVAVDPLFTSSTDFTLASSSPCKNAGDNAAYDVSYPEVDLNNHTRVVSTIDMGAYETSPSTGISSTVSKESDFFSVENGSLTVKASGEVAIYNVIGKLVSKKVSTGSTNFSLNSGIYLVNVSGTTYKIIVQ